MSPYVLLGGFILAILAPGMLLAWGLSNRPPGRGRDWSAMGDELDEVRDEFARNLIEYPDQGADALELYNLQSEAIRRKHGYLT